AHGTSAARRATVAPDAREFGAEKIQQVDAHLGLLGEKGTAALDGAVLLGGDPALAVTAQAPFDLIRALRDRGYLRGALQRPVKGDLAVTKLPLDRLARSGLLPAGSSGTVSLSARLTGTVVDPIVELNTAGEDVTVGRLHRLA